ncbi:MAG TPA: hypothetical protein PLX69_24030 [Leptospiraceae bacterium]|nr:hypothetical protein [Leptospiraceae bacterium]
MIGRFLQADSVVMPESTFGMNRYMYVEGNPVKYRDESGHKLSTSQGSMLLGYLAAPQHGMSREEGLAWGSVAGRRATINEKGNKWQQSDLGRINWERGFDSIIGKDGLLGSLGNAIGIQKMANYFNNVKNNVNGDTYNATKEGHINNALEMILTVCQLESPSGSNQKAMCTSLRPLMARYNERRRSKSTNTDPFSNTKAFKIKSDDKYFACAVLFQQYEEWKKIRRDPSDPAPTNTSNGESYDPPNRLNGCTLENY